MIIYYLCDSCGYRGRATAGSADQILCEVCGEPVLEDPDRPPEPDRPRDPA